MIETIRSTRLPFISDDHLFTTDDARPIAHGLHILSGCRWVSIVHVLCRCAISHQVAYFAEEGASGHVNVSNHVERQTVKSENHGKEGEINGQLDAVGDEIEGKDAHALAFPWLLAAHVDAVDYVLADGIPNLREQN